MRKEDIVIKKSRLRKLSERLLSKKIKKIINLSQLEKIERRPDKEDDLQKLINALHLLTRVFVLRI